MLCMSSSFDHNSDITVTRLKAFPCSWLLLLREGSLRKGEKLFLLGGSPSHAIGEASVSLARYAS